MSTISTQPDQSQGYSTVRQFIGGHFVSPAEVFEMRQWIEDCGFEDVKDEVNLDWITDSEVVHGVQRTYDGGVSGFLLSMAPLEPMGTGAA